MFFTNLKSYSDSQNGEHRYVCVYVPVCVALIYCVLVVIKSLGQLMPNHVLTPLGRGGGGVAAARALLLPHINQP